MAKADEVLEKLGEVEAEMRRIGYWNEELDCDAVRAQAQEIMETQRRSPVGLMPFEHWLQAIFVPNARAAAEAGKLPSSSQVGVMAMREYDYHSHVPEAQGLLGKLNEFDRLFD